MSLFKSWMIAMGYNGKQVSKAGAAIGMGTSSALVRYRGEKDPDHMERLAMAAVAAGLPAWSPERDEELRACGRVIGAVREAIGSKAER